MHISFFLLPLFAVFSASQDLSIPTELTTGFTSSTNLVLTFGSNELTNGQVVPLATTRTAPTFALGDSDGINTNANYIIVCIDPDAPAPASQVLHFLGTDFSPAPGIGTNLTSDVEPALEYMPPGPPEGTGPHRYIWLLYRQPRGFTIQNVPTNRTGFDVEAWRVGNALGEAVAGTFFVAEFGGEYAGMWWLVVLGANGDRWWGRIELDGEWRRC